MPTSGLEYSRGHCQRSYGCGSVDALGRLWKGKTKRRGHDQRQKYPMTLLNTLDLLLVAFCAITLILVFVNPCGEGTRREY